MAYESLRIILGGVEADDLYPDLLSLEVELDDALTAMTRLLLGLSQERDGAWRLIDDARLRVWRPLEIRAGFDGSLEPLFAGYITHLRPSFDPDPALCTLEVWAMDASVLMDRQERLKDWPDKKDSDIASEIFGAYGLRPMVDNTAVVHDTAISTIIQRETDLQFLRRLAERNGFECFVEGQVGYFRAARLDAPPQPVLAAHFGPETTLRRFSAEVNALTPAAVSFTQLDRSTRELLEAVVEQGEQLQLGRRGAETIIGEAAEPARAVVGRVAVTGLPELALYALSQYHQGSWFVTGEGEVDANRYGHVLRARRPVTIKGVGEALSGIYMVSHVTHRFADEGYTQLFNVRRNAMVAHGDEPFGAQSARQRAGRLGR